MKLDHDKFITASALQGDKKEGMNTIITFLENDPYMADIRWCAYVLATIGRECGGEWAPVEETGKGKGREYGGIAGPYGLVYYGRGYTQNTWLSNYQMLTEAWNRAHPNVPVSFVQHPELLLIPEYSYWVTSFAMRHGAYTGVGLPKYIHDNVCDYLYARKIINGMDHAQEIADAAKWFEDTLKCCLLD